MAARRNAQKLTCSREGLQSLEPYLLRAVVTKREYDLSAKALIQAASNRGRKELVPPASVASDAFFHLWIALLWVLAEGWQKRLRCSDTRIKELLASEFTPFLKQFRDVVFHFDPHFRDTPLQYAGEEDEVLVWLEDLTEAFAAFFLRELGPDSMLSSVVARRAPCPPAGV
ncbi:MAG: hypothetical protein ABR543_04570 [Gemmatimonadaceae bacterium]